VENPDGFPDENGLIDYALAATRRLLEASFTGAAELRKQLQDASVERVLGEQGTSHVHHILFAVQPASPAPVKSWAPVRADARDSDGVPIEFILHTNTDRVLSELEIVRLDGTPIRRYPAIPHLDVWVPNP
jgi:hypothetical protein